MTVLSASEVIVDPMDLDQEWAAWDALAMEASRPYCAPGWAIPWWASARPAASDFRAVAVRDGTALAGLAPFYLTRDRFRITTWHLLADVVSSYVEPLARPDALEQVAAAIAAGLARADQNVDVVSLAAVPRTSPWLRLLYESWPNRRPRMSIVRSMRAPYVDVADGGYDKWWASRSRNFRQQMSRRRKEFVRLGGQFRLATSRDEVSSALAEFERLHRQRWEQRGGSQALTAPVAEMLRRACEVLPPDRLQVWTAAVDGASVGAALFVAAGAEMHYWLGGFDEDWSRCSPSLLLLVEAVRHATGAGYRRVVLGPGAGAYKYRLATGEEVLDWVDLLPHGKRYSYVRLCQSPYRLYRLASNHTPPEVKQRMWASVATLRGGAGETRAEEPAANRQPFLVPGRKER
jgi:CelD/BcsL family acetyltransferase involved in cellulose biosynthesis